MAWKVDRHIKSKGKCTFYNLSIVLILLFIRHRLKSMGKHSLWRSLRASHCAAFREHPRRRRSMHEWGRNEVNNAMHILPIKGQMRIEKENWELMERGIQLDSWVKSFSWPSGIWLINSTIWGRGDMPRLGLLWIFFKVIFHSSNKVFKRSS